MMMKIPKLPFGLTLPRLVLLIVGIVYLISGLGSTAFWTLKVSGNEIFVPFGLSTFRSLDWPMSDFVLIFCCFFAAFHAVFNTSKAAMGCKVGGFAFIVQGILGFYIDSSPETREQFGIERKELQEAFLNFWFIGWGSFTVWVGYAGLQWLSKFQTQDI